MDIQRKISNILGQEYAKIDSDDRTSDLKRARKEISETDDQVWGQFPDRFVSNHNIVWKKMREFKDSKGPIVKYHAYWRGHILDNVWFRSVDEMKRYTDNFILSISQYNKLKHEPEKEIEEVTGAASAGGYVGPLFVSPIKKGKKKKGEMKEDLNAPLPTENDIAQVMRPKMKKQDVDEVTDSSSSGSYETPFFLAKNKKNWRGNKKTQIPGGKFVKVKDKCKTYPYCNQGIGALHLSESSKLHKKIISHLNETLGVEEKEVQKYTKKMAKESLFRKRMREMNQQRINKSELKNKKK